MAKSNKFVSSSLHKEKVKKHVAAIHTSGELSLLERKMANVFLLNAYDDLLTKRTHTINVQLLSTMLGWNESNNIQRLKSALEALASTPITFNEMKDGKETWRVMSMISYGQIENGICTYRYDEFLAERLYDPEVYATINLKIQRKIDGSYALALYENCLRYKNVGSTGWWDIDLFRRIVGADNAYYDDFRRLNSKIIKKSIDEINKVTDIEIHVEFKKSGRRVSALKFLVKENPQQTLLSSEDLDEFAELRKTKIYKSLREHGIGERLAILWIMQDEEQAIHVVDYVEQRANKNQVKGSTAGYIRKLIEENADVGKSHFDAKLEKTKIENKEKEEKKIILERKKRQLSEDITKQINAIIKAMSVEDTKSFIDKYNSANPNGQINSYNEVTGKIKDSVERINFMTWLRGTIRNSITGH